MDKFLDYVVPTLFTGILAFSYNVFGHGYLPESPHVWIDTVANMTEFMAAKLITEMTVDKVLSGSDFAMKGADLVMEPLLHGLLNGIVKPFQINMDSVNALGFVGSLYKGKAPLPQHYTFNNGFMDGLQYNIGGTYLAMPITG